MKYWQRLTGLLERMDPNVGKTRVIWKLSLNTTESYVHVFGRRVHLNSVSLTPYILCCLTIDVWELER